MQENCNIHNFKFLSKKHKIYIYISVFIYLFIYFLILKVLNFFNIIFQKLIYVYLFLIIGEG